MLHMHGGELELMVAAKRMNVQMVIYELTRLHAENYSYPRYFNTFMGLPPLTLIVLKEKEKLGPSLHYTLHLQLNQDLSDSSMR